MQKNRVLEPLLVFVLGTLLVSCYFYWQFTDMFTYMFVGIPAGLHHGPEKGLLSYFLGGDHIQVMYLGWKLKEAIATLGFSVLTDGYNFTDLAKPFYDFHIGVQFQMIAAMMGITGSESAGYTLTMVPLSGILTFCSGYYLASQVTPSKVFRICSGIYFLLIPYRIIQSVGGHSGGVVLFLHCLYWTMVLKGMKEERSTKSAIYAGFLLIILTISDEHQGYYAILFSGFVFPIWFVQSLAKKTWKDDARKFFIKWSPLVLGLILTICYGLIVDMVALNPGDGISSHREISDVASYSVKHHKFFSATSIYNVGSSLGCLFLACFIGIGLSRILKVRSALTSPFLPFFICLIFSTILMGGINAKSEFLTGIYQFFFKNVPYFSYQRVPTKMFSASAIFLVVIIAAQHTWIVKQLVKKNRRKLAITFSTIVAIFFIIQSTQMHNKTSALGWPIIDPIYAAIPPEDVDLIKSGTKIDEPILFAPLSKVMDRYATKQQLLAMLTSRRYSGGYNGNAPMSYLTTVEVLRSINYQNPDQEFFNQATQRGFKTMIFDLKGPKNLYDSDLSKPDRFAKFFEEPICGKTLCLMRFSSL